MAQEKETFGEVRERLEEIVAQVKSKDTSLEKSLDLYEEAIRLGNRAAELIDKPDFTDEEMHEASQAIATGQQDDHDVSI